MGNNDTKQEGLEGLGKVNIQHDAISTIARQVIEGIPGIVRMSGSVVSAIAGRFSKRKRGKGIKTKVKGDEVYIEVFVIVEYGVKIPEIAWQIQKNIRKAIEEMTGLHVSSVDVNIEGVELPEKSEGETLEIIK